MCYIMISKKINNNRKPEVEDKIRQVALEQMKSNDDGFFIQQNGKEIRTTSAILAEQAVKEMPFDNAIMHFRQATVGKINLDNVHGWSQDGFQFLHNGVISDYTPKRSTDYGALAKDNPGLEWEHTDSYMLFQDLLKQIKELGGSDKKIIKAIKQVINNVNFWGRAVLLDQTADKAFLFGDWHVYLAEQSYLIFSSHAISLEQEFVTKSHGMDFEYSQDPLLETEFDGIAIIKRFSQPNFHYKFRGDLLDDAFDNRVYEPVTPAYSSGLKVERYNGPDKESDEQMKKRWAEEDAELDLKYSNALAQDDNYDDRDNPLLTTEDYLAELAEIPEYQNMNPFDMTVYTDETGTHDEANICCEYQTCWLYKTIAYDQYVKSLKKQREMDFVKEFSGEKTKEIPSNELILEI